MRLCKEVSFEDVLKCSLDLSDAEVNTFKSVLDLQEPFTVTDLSEHLDRDRSVAQRHLKKFLEKGIVKRIQKNKDEGGYEFFYRVIDREKLKEILRNGLKDFTSQVESVIDGL